MNLFEYIKSQLPHLPNPAIMKNLGASEELIGYVRETVWNTNLGMMKTLGCEADTPIPSGEVWFVGTIDESETCNDGYRFIMPNNTEITDIADPEALKASPTDYSIKMNGLDLPIFNETHGDTPEAYTYTWSEAQADTPPFLVYQNPVWGMAVPCEWTGEVEVTVIHK